MTKESKKFVLNLMDISELLGNPEFKTNITIGKVLKIIEDLIDGKKTSKNLSKKVKLINYLRFLKKPCRSYRNGLLWSTPDSSVDVWESAFV